MNRDRIQFAASGFGIDLILISNFNGIIKFDPGLSSSTTYFIQAKNHLLHGVLFKFNYEI